MRKIHALTLILGATLAAAANSATTGTTFAVTETVLSTCSATASTLAFSPYTPGGGVITTCSHRRVSPPSIASAKIASSAMAAT